MTREGRRFDESPFGVGAGVAAAGTGGYIAADTVKRNRNMTERFKTFTSPVERFTNTGKPGTEWEAWKTKPLAERLKVRARHGKNATKDLFKNPIKDRTWTSAKTLPKGTKALAAIGGAGLLAGTTVAAANQGKKHVIHKSGFGIDHDIAKGLKIPGFLKKPVLKPMPAEPGMPRPEGRPDFGKPYWSESAEGKAHQAWRDYDKASDQVKIDNLAASRRRMNVILPAAAGGTAGTGIMGGAFAIHRGSAKYENTKRRKIKQNPKWKALP